MGGCNCDLRSFYHEVSASLALNVALSLAIAQGGNVWPLFVFALYVPLRTYFTFDTTDIHATIALSGYFVSGKGSLLDCALKVLVQVLASILAAWISYVVVDSADEAPIVGEYVSNTRAFIVLAVVVGFVCLFDSSLRGPNCKDRALYTAFLWISSVYLIQGVCPYAIGDFSTDIGRVIAARIYGQGGSTDIGTDNAAMDPSTYFDFGGVWVFIVGPLLGVLGCKAYHLLEATLGKCFQKNGGGDGKGYPQHPGNQGMVNHAEPQGVQMPQYGGQPQQPAYGSPIHGSVPQY